MAKTQRPTEPEQDDVMKAVESTEPERVTDPIEDADVISAEAPVADPEPAAQTPEPAVGAQASQPTDPPGKNQGSGFFGMVVGGVIAAAAGYAVATYVPMGGLSDTAGKLAAQQEDLAKLTEQLAALQSAPAPDAGLAERIAALESATSSQPAPATVDLAPVTDAIDALTARVTALENAPPGVAGAAPAGLVTLVESLKAEVEALKGSGDTAKAEIEAMAAQAQARIAEADAQAAQLRAEAEETARKAMSRAAISRLQAALESGAPFASALADLGDLEIADVLSANAANGLPSQRALQEAFPEAARSALEASLRADMGESWTERAASFLQSTTGARSLVPREGTDPDAVLSRAEAAVGAGDMQAALTELQGLPPEGQAAMAGFVAMAQQRLDALAAIESLSQAVEG